MRQRNALLWSWSLAGLILFSNLANGVMSFDEMDLFNNYNATNEGNANVLKVGLTLVQAAAAKGAGKSEKYIFAINVAFNLTYEFTKENT